MGKRNQRWLNFDEAQQGEQAWQDLRQESVEEKRPRLRPLTKNQPKYFRSLETDIITICVGPAGTGKTWIACGIASEMLKAGKIDRIIITRPLVECGEEVGTLPGDLMEKVGEMMAPMLDAFGDFFTPQEIKRLMMEEKLAIIPLGKMRGRSLKNAFIILDEAQNATFRQLRMFLTRFALNSRVVVNGDYTQSDLPSHVGVPLFEVIRKFKAKPGFTQKPISVVTLTREDIVRHPLIQWVDEALTDEVSPEVEKPFVEEWYDEKCPSCDCTLWYEDAEETADQVECHHCHAIIDLYDGDEYSPAVTGSGRMDKCRESFPRKP